MASVASEVPTLLHAVRVSSDAPQAAPREPPEKLPLTPTKPGAVAGGRAAIPPSFIGPLAPIPPLHSPPPRQPADSENVVMCQIPVATLRLFYHVTCECAYTSSLIHSFNFAVARPSR